MRKKTPCIFFVLLLIVNVLLVSIPSVLTNAQLPIISLSPSELTIPAPGESFTVAINVTDVANMRGFAFKLDYNTTVLDATIVASTSISATATKWLPVDESLVFHWDAPPTINDTIGRVWVGAWGFTTFTGNGSVLTINFTATAAGNSSLHLYETELLNLFAEPINHTTRDGFVMVSPKIGDFHVHHINDATDDFPNDYVPMTIPFNANGITIAPVITCTTFEDDVWKPNYHPCKLAQTLLFDDNWSDKDANYTYVFEDWTDYDWNDIVVDLYAVTNDIIEVTIRLESREAAWKNPFSIKITPIDMVVEVQVCWNSTDYPEEHTLRLDPGETVNIELFSESNPCDIAFVTMIPLVPPVASFFYSPSDPHVCENVTFNALASTPNGPILHIVGYEWDFGDASPHGAGVVVTHHYTAPGTYTVTLNVTDNFGTWDTETKTILVTPPSPPVGGQAAPIDKSRVLDLRINLAPEIGLVCLLILLAAAAVAIISIRRKNKTLK